MSVNRQAIVAQFFTLTNTVTAIRAEVAAFVERRTKAFSSYPARIEAARKQIASMEAAIEAGEKPKSDAERNTRKRARKAEAELNSLIRSHSWLDQLQLPTVDDLLAQVNEQGDAEGDAETEEA